MVLLFHCNPSENGRVVWLFSYYICRRTRVSFKPRLTPWIPCKMPGQRISFCMHRGSFTPPSSPEKRFSRPLYIRDMRDRTFPAGRHKGYCMKERLLEYCCHRVTPWKPKGERPDTYPFCPFPSSRFMVQLKSEDDAQYHNEEVVRIRGASNSDRVAAGIFTWSLFAVELVLVVAYPNKCKIFPSHSYISLR